MMSVVIFCHLDEYEEILLRQFFVLNLLRRFNGSRQQPSALKSIFPPRILLMIVSDRLALFSIGAALHAYYCISQRLVRAVTKLV
jgi:hypothetical protein